MNEVKINGVSSRELNLDIISWSRDFLPTSRDELEYIEGKDGPIHRSKALGSRSLSITFRAYFDTDIERAKVQSDVAEWIFSKNFFKLEPSDEPNIYYMAKVLDDSDLDPELFTSEFTIVFTCQPLKYGANQEFVYSGTSSSFINAGTYESAPIITINLWSSTNNLVFTMNGFTISYESDSSLSSTDVIVIDGRELEFRVNGNLLVEEIEGHFPVVIKGDNEFSINTTADITIDWQEQYL